MNPVKLMTIACGIGVAAVAGTFLLPDEVTIERQATLKAQPNEIIAILASAKAYQRINPYRNTDPNLSIQTFGPATGVGSGFHFKGKEGVGSQTVTHLTTNSVTYGIDLGDMGTPSQSVSATPVSGGTKVVWRMRMDLGMNPLMRILGLGFDAMMGETLETGLTNLSRVAVEQ